jgi:hypothetical protein
MPPRKLPRTIRKAQKNATRTPSPGKVRARKASALTASGLQPQHELFALEFLKDYNGTQAYMRVRPRVTPKAASVAAGYLLANAGVRAFIKAKMAQVAERVSFEVEDVIRQLVAIAGADLADFIDIDGSLLPIHAMPRHARSALASVKLSKKNLTAGDGVTEDVVEIKLWDKNRALETLARVMGMIIDRNERGKAGDFDSLPPDELHQKLAELRAAREARAAARGEAGATIVGVAVPATDAPGATP